MFRTLMMKEIQQTMHSSRFALAMILCLVILPIGFFTNGRQYKIKLDTYRKSEQYSRENRRTVRNLLSNGGVARRPPSDLNILSNGVDHLLPTSIETKGYFDFEGVQTVLVNSRQIDEPYSLLYGPLDMVSIMGLVLSVMAILFTFSSVSGEKEEQTLSLILSNTVPRSNLILAKALSSFILLGSAFSSGVVLGSIVLIGMGLLFDTVSLFLFLGGIGVCLLYLSVFISLGIMISCFNRSTISSLIALIAIWISFTMILPKTSVILAKLLTPVKSQQVINLEKNQVRNQFNDAREEGLEQLVDSNPSLRGLSYDEYFQKLRDHDPAVTRYLEEQAEFQKNNRKELEAALEKIESEYRTLYSKQGSFARNLSRISPFACFIHILTELGGTGILESEAWQSTRQEYGEILYREIGTKFKPSERFRGFSSTPNDLDREAEAPFLESKRVPSISMLSFVAPDIFLLALYGILFYTIAVMRFLRYDAR